MATERLKHPGSAFTWIDVCNPSSSELQELSAEFNLNASTLADCLEPDHLPKVEDLGNATFIITRKIIQQELNRKLHTVQQLSTKVAVFYNTDFIITIHRLAQPFLDDIKKRVLDGPKKVDTTVIVSHILLEVLHSYHEPALKLAAELEDYETKVFLRNGHTSILGDLYYLKRKISLLIKLLVLSEDIGQAIRNHGKNNPALQDAKDTQTKLLTLFGQLHDDVSNLLPIYLSISAQKTNEVMKVLTIFSVFFMPLTFIVGIYGMNFEFMPELKSPWGYPLVLASMVAITGFIFWWFKRKKWF